MSTVSTTDVKFLGIDFSGDAKQWRPGRKNSNIWIAELEASSTRLGRVISLQRVQQIQGDEEPFARLARRLRRRDFIAAGIDAPFSLPSSLQYPTHSQLLERLDRLPCGKRAFPRADVLIQEFLPDHAPNGKKIYRETEVVWSKRGVNVRSATFWKHRGGAPFAAAAIKLLAAVGGSIWPFAKPGSQGLLVEAFPAAQLQTLGLPHQGYSGPGQGATRLEIVEALEQRVLDFGIYREDSCECPDALDAVIRALAGYAVVANRVRDLPGPEASKEGWIAVAAA